MTNTSNAIQFTLFATSIGTCGVAWRGDLVVATRLPDACPATTVRFFEDRRNAEEAMPPEPVQRVITAMTRLLEGDRIDLSFIACGFEGIDPFAAKVYAVTRNLAPGETSTYGEIGEKQRAREVGQALANNPLPIIVPCHRVLGAGGKLTGFSATGGVQLKLKMLEIEGAQIGGAPGLFGNLPLSVKT